MRKIFFIVFSLLFSTIIFAQDSTLLRIDNQKVPLSEFKRIYLKNNRDSSITKKSLEEYLELFTNFKLKVTEAELLQFDKKKSFIKELNSYRKQLIKPYLTDSSTDENLMHEAYSRMQWVVRASHILLKLPKDAQPKDTLKVYEKALKIKKEIAQGGNFEKLAKQYSTDPSVRYNSGDLGYFTAFKMVYAFESAAYSLKIGEISNPVRSQFGYHIIKLTDKKKAPGLVKAAHIMVRLPQSASKEDSKKALNKINALYDSLKSGVSFDKLAQKYSEDPQTARVGGELPEFYPGRMLPTFEKNIYETPIGKFSKPFRTKVGWHIVKKLKTTSIKSFAEEKQNIKRNLSKTTRANFSKEKVIERLKKQYNFAKNTKAIDAIYNSLNTDSLMKNSFVLDNKIKSNAIIFSFKNNSIKANKLLTDLKRRIRQPKSSKNAYFNKVLNDFINRKIIGYAEAHMEESHPDFASLMKEYHDGILLFNITDSLVWRKAVKDTIGLQQFYKNNTNKYQYKKRVLAEIITITNPHSIKKTQKIIKKLIKKHKTEDIQKYLRKKYRDTTILVKIDTGKFEKEINRYIDSTNFKLGLTMADNGNIETVWVNNIKYLKKGPKPLNKIKGIVTADYQNLLEKQWIKELKKKHTIKINKDLIYSLLK